MGTRADFYVGKGENAEWLGSIAWDGYPQGIASDILFASTEATYRAAVAEFFGKRDDVTLPEQGWPWPWDDSQISDYAYTFAAWEPGLESGCTWYTIESPDRWWRAAEWDNEPDDRDLDYKQKIESLELAVHPDMSARKNVRWDGGSGLMIVRRKSND